VTPPRGGAGDPLPPGAAPPTAAASPAGSSPTPDATGRSAAGSVDGASELGVGSALPAILPGPASPPGGKARSRARPGAGLSAFIHESVLSCGGQVVLPAGFLRAAYDAVRAAGGVCIADEVQTGLGRSGSAFWAFQAVSAADGGAGAGAAHPPPVVPDVVTIGKPLGNGFPVSAVVTTPAIARAFAAGGHEYFNTFGGNPVAAAAAAAVLAAVDDMKLQDRAAAVGAALLAGLRGLAAKYTSGPVVIGSVRGLGLMVGVEFVLDAAGRAPDGATASAVKYRALAPPYRLLLSTDGMEGEVVKLKPPMVFTAADVARVVAAVDDILAGLVAEGGAPGRGGAGEPHA
jgi:ethanolamine-phosphate phospho-lyase